MLVLSRADVERLLDLDRLVDALAAAMIEVSAGRVSMPARIAAFVPDREGLLGAMPVWLGDPPVLETKLVSLFPHNRDRPTHQAVIVCFDPDTGSPMALMDATYVTEARTAAGSALSVRLLARPEAEVAAVLGTGAQARAHARALVRVRALKTLRVAGRDPSRAAALADELGAELGCSVEPAAGYAEAVDGADIVCATTHSPDPVVRREWLAPGTHVCSVGFNTAGREVDAETVRDALVVVESRDAALAPPPSGTNDLLWAIRDGVIGADHVHAEIGEIVSGARPGRTDAAQITLYKSVGVAAQDAAAAALVLEAARATRTGTTVEI